jgi:large subunit ribosomal protein L49
MTRKANARLISLESRIQSASSFTFAELPSSQIRHIVSRISLPYSKSKSTKGTATESTSPSTPTPSSPSAPAAAGPALPLTNLPYFIRRTPSNQLPVYLVTKAGGTKQQTKIQKTEGDLDALRADLARALGLEQNPSDVTINRLNGHIIVKVCIQPVLLITYSPLSASVYTGGQIGPQLRLTL